MNWKRWKIGLLVAMLTGFFTGLVTLGVVDSVTWVELGILLAVNIAKDALLFLKEHPVETVEENGVLAGK